MGPKTETKTIDSIEFQCTQFGAFKAYSLSAKVLQVFGTSLFSGGFQNLDLSDISADQFVSLSLELLAQTRAKGVDVEGLRWYTLDRQENIDHVFAGKPLSIYKVVMFAVQVNFGDFLGEGLTANPSKKAAETEQKQQ